jgi:FkbM family methyltransferase
VGSVIRRLSGWFKGSVMQKDEMDLALDHLVAKGYAPRVVLDIGSAKGYWSLRAGGRWKDAQFYMIDPLTESEPSLKDIVAKHPRFHYVLTAVGDQPGEVIMNLTADCDGSSALDYPGADPNRQRRIPVETIDNLLAAGKLAAPNLVKIDVQGFEMHVLRGGQRMFASADVFIIETNLYRFMPDCPLLHEVVAYMAERGYRIFDLAGSLRRPFENDLAQIDVVFVSEKSNLVESNRWA